MALRLNMQFTGKLLSSHMTLQNIILYAPGPKDPDPRANHLTVVSTPFGHLIFDN